MIKFLIKYRILLTIAVVLCIIDLWLIPRQESLYLRADFKQAKTSSHNFLIGSLVVGVIVVLFFALRNVKNIKEVLSALGGAAALSIPFYFLFKSVFLSAFLLINGIELRGKVEKKYTITFFGDFGRRTPGVYDFTKNQPLLFEHIGNIKKLQHLHRGDTIIISFDKGLLGINFAPTVK